MKNTLWEQFKAGLFRGKAERETLHNVVEYAPNAIILIDQDGLIQMVNTQTELGFEYSRQELIGHPVEMLLPHRFRNAHPAQRNSFFAHPARRAMGSGRDLYGMRKDGTEFPIEIGLTPIPSGGKTLAMASIIDITERKRAEERFRQVIESAPNAIVVVNRHGEVTLVNAQMEKIFGYPRNEVVGNPVDILIPERFRSRHASFINAFFAYPSTRSMGAGRELYGRKRDGTEFPVEIGLNPMASDEGPMVLASIFDISERKLADEKANRLRQELHEVISVLATANEEIMCSVNQAVTSSQDTATAISEIAATVEEVKQTALMAGSKAKTVVESAEQTRKVAKEGHAAVNDTLQGMQQIRTQMEGIGESITQLCDQTQTIGDVVAAVNDLAEQSNLLGVNASIEAVKAGEVGRGFSVVAQEVKSLAEQSKVATKQVRAILADIQKAMNKTVLVAEQGHKAVEIGSQRAQFSGEAIKALMDNVTTSSQMAIQIAATSQQQISGMDQIAQAIQSIREASQGNVSGIRQVEETIRNLHQLGAKLQELAAHFKP
ncbi:PAS domain S-box protein [Hahella aquimaris]|uniref:methyl-accepting chemotaxis protein n=1 Tax=Hahella sp. HNIBRBA332 TaxID=3015983 RepID=UPI00273C94C5|nr:PAS domain S-box protein [Hahella sp. HNIBRBA332]WLQ11983.1 PAS domain S-box protein [Hahella sp. HNIBRBA332]